MKMFLNAGIRLEPGSVWQLQQIPHISTKEVSTIQWLSSALQVAPPTAAHYSGWLPCSGSAALLTPAVAQHRALHCLSTALLAPLKWSGSVQPCWHFNFSSSNIVILTRSISAWCDLWKTWLTASENRPNTISRQYIGCSMLLVIQNRPNTISRL